MKCDFLILADAVQVQQDKLYMLGGAWTFVWAREFPVSHPMGLAAGLLVDWSETNTRHTLKMVVRNEDTGEELWKAEGEFETGRPVGIPSGMEQRMVLGFNLTLLLDEPRDFVAELLVNGTSLAKSAFKSMAQRVV